MFYEAEVQESGEERNRLACPSGPEDADLGLIMHCQSKDGEVGPFWDMTNASIQALAAKGLSEDFTFCYDWHWRAESSPLGRGLCPAKSWKRAVQSLHNALSYDILAMLPLPVVVVVGKCARIHYESVPSSKVSRRLEVMLIPGTHLTFDLDFSNHAVKRMTAYIDHPATGFFGRPAGENISLRIDAAFNFFLWLLGKSHDPISLQWRYIQHRDGMPALVAPLEEIRYYIRAEREKQSLLQREDYRSEFWFWTEGFLKEKPSAILRKGKSVAVAVREELNVNPRLLPGNAKDMPELRRRLLTNASFKCSKMENGTNLGRVYLRGVAIMVTQIADFGMVQVHCNLSPEGVEHPTPCATNTINRDPAKRVGIMLTYNVQTTDLPQSVWYKQRGKANTMKLNSLVDFLTGKDDEYTESQPRRFLDKSKIRGRTCISYTGDLF